MMYQCTDVSAAADVNLTAGFCVRISCSGDKCNYGGTSTLQETADEM
jgi:hypothetical protein